MKSKKIGYITKTYHEPDDLEVLAMDTHWYDGTIQWTAIAPLENEEMSMVISKKYADTVGSRSFIHAIFNKEEVELLLEAIQKVKKQWDEDNEKF